MLNRKRVLTGAGIVILVTIAIFIVSHRTPQEPIVKYIAVEFSPSTETQSDSQAHPNSEREMGTPSTNEDIDASVSPNTDDSFQASSAAEQRDEAFSGERLNAPEVLDAETIAGDAEISEDNGYPEVPSGFPFKVVWQAPEEQLAQMPAGLFEELEVMGLVMIKLWNEGDQGFSGAFMADGKVYPTYLHVAYVKWDKSEGSGAWQISEVTTVKSSVSEQLLNGVVPPGIEIIDQDSAGIHPYAFLSE